MATALPAITEYIHPGTAVLYWLPAVADKNSPTRQEMNAATAYDLTPQIADAPGWDTSAESKPLMRLSSRYTGKISGRIESEDPKLVFWASEDTEDIRDVLSRGDRGFVMLCLGGDVPGQKADVYPVEVMSLSKPVSVEGDPAQITVSFAVPTEPGEDVTIPATD